MTYHHGNLRQAALEAARALLEDQGPAKVSLRAVAQRVDVTHRALYRHFPDRDALMAELAQGSLEAILAAMKDASEAAAPEPSARLAAATEAYLDFALDRPAVYRQAMTAGFAKRGAHPGLAKAARALGNDFGALVVAAADPTDPTEAAGAKDRAIARWGTLHGLVDLYWGGALRARSVAAARRYILEQVLA